MKTPREVLLNRHAAAEPRLDQVRHSVVAGLNERRTSWVQICLSACEGFFRLPRTALAALGVAWIAIIALNLASTEAPRAALHLTSEPSKRSPEMQQALREQQQLFAELVGAVPRADVDARRFIPRPRSERSNTVAVA